LSNTFCSSSCRSSNNLSLSFSSRGDICREGTCDVAADGAAVAAAEAASDDSALDGNLLCGLSSSAGTSTAHILSSYQKSDYVFHFKLSREADI